MMNTTSTDLLIDGCVRGIKGVRNEVHTIAVEAAISRREPNRVLGTIPHDIGEEETDMNRGERTALAQLRSGFSANLENFQNRIGVSDSPLCPCCRQADHTVEHIFEYREHPTNLTSLDM